MEAKTRIATIRILTAGLLAACLSFSLWGPACKSKPSSTTSAVMERAMSRSDAPQKLSQGMTKLMNAVSKEPLGNFHYSSKSQENINPKFPNEQGSKPVIGPVALEAEVTADTIQIDSTRGKETKTVNAKKGDQLGWPMAQLELSGSLFSPVMAIAVGSSTARAAGSEMVGSVATDKYEFDTANASAAERAGIDAAMGMLGGRQKLTAVKGTAWIDKATGRVVKFDVATDLSDKAGNSWKETCEATYTPK